jgi:ABC-type polysaccharide/polyol phosphate export permease
MVGVVQSWRAVLLDGAWPDPRVLSGLLVLGIVLLIAGRRIFVSQSHRFAEEM